MVAASRIVCALAALCAAVRAAPLSVTYDQRQHGEFNLQVEADGVAVVLMPGGSAADLFLDRKHYGLAGLQQIFGRRHGGVEASRKKKKKPAPQDCTSTATQPEKPYTESPLNPSATAAGSSSTTQLPTESPELQYASESPAPSASEPSPVSEESPSPSEEFPSEESAAAETPKENAADVAAPEELDVRHGTDHRHYIRPGTPVDDPYSVTPNTPDIFPRPETDGDGDYDHDVENSDAAMATATDPAAETTAQVTGDAAAAAETTAQVTRDAAAVAPDTKPAAVQATDFEEKPVSVSSSDAKTVDKPAVGADDEVVDAVEAHTKPAAVADAKPHTEDKPAAVPVKNESPTDKTYAEAAKKPADEQSAVEMVAMKTMEKPTVSEPLKVVQAKNKQPSSSSSSSSAEKPAEMVAMKTIEKPSTSSSAAADKAGIAAKPVPEAPARNDAIKGGDGHSEPAVSGSKPTEMVAVKTVDSPGAATTAKSVVSVKTVIRPAGSPKTAVRSNGTSIMRKVGDRKPMPTVTLEVSHPKVVV